MADMDGTHIPRVNGSMLGNYIDKQVLLIAELMSLENSKMKIKCCDGCIILANLHEAITQNLEAGTKVQVLAIPKSKNVIQCEDFIVLQDDNNDFDMNLYNEAVKLYAENFDTNTYLINDLVGHWGSTNEKEIELIDKPEPTSKPNGEQFSQPPQGDDTFA